MHLQVVQNRLVINVVAMRTDEYFVFTVLYVLVMDSDQVLKRLGVGHWKAHQGYVEIAEKNLFDSFILVPARNRREREIVQGVFEFKRKRYILDYVSNKLVVRYLQTVERVRYL